ncbi:MAG: L,D-transpeptidase [Alkalilacustris sp.]
MLERRGLLAGLGAMGLLGGCMAPPPPDPPVFAAIDYGARRDGAFTVPAVPIDQVPEWLHRQVVPFETEAAPGDIVIQSDHALLHLVLEDGFALRYGVSVGREGLGWRGEAEVYRTARWPRWTPTPAMIRRDPSLERWADGQDGGPRNPLGARALYLRTLATGRDEGIRIHGTPEWRSIGRRASSGCFRMIQQDVIDLHGRVGRGTRVSVV